jgi:hypothetical protein
LQDYLVLKARATGKVVQCARSVLESWLAARAECAKENHHYGSGFNPLSRIPIKEPVHSKILGDFLDPQGSHGQGALFLRCFLEMLGVPDREMGVWRISIESCRVDILLWRESPASMILIESKVKDAVDRTNQIYRYWHHQMYQWKPGHWRDQEALRSFRLIYLSADGSKRPASDSLVRPADWSDEINPHKEVPLKCETVSLRDLINCWRVRVLEAVPVSNQRLSIFFELYEELWMPP